MSVLHNGGMSDDDVTLSPEPDETPDVSVGGQYEPEHWTAENGQPQENAIPDEGLLQVVAGDDEDFDTVVVHYPDGSTETIDRPTIEWSDFDELMGSSQWVSTNVPRPPLWTPSQAVAQARYQVNHHTCPHFSTYAGLCEHLTACMYGFGSSGYYDAYSHWRLTPEKYSHYNRDIPKGGLAFWRSGPGGSGHGHTAQVVTDSRGIASNDIYRYGRVDIAPLSAPESRWGQHYLGWTPPYFPRAVGTNGQHPVGGSASQPDESDWSKGAVYMSRLHFGQDNSDSVRRTKYRLKHSDVIPHRLREPLDPENGYYGPHLAEAIEYWQKHRPNASESKRRRGEDYGKDLTGHEAEALFGERYTIHHDGR